MFPASQPVSLIQLDEDPSQLHDPTKLFALLPFEEEPLRA